jgi:hypothetical protein
VSAERPVPRFAVGQRVSVVINERNTTQHAGAIREVIWHFKEQRYNYYLIEGGKKVSKRYLEDDLKPE